MDTELTSQEINQLATYNGEIARGIVHTPEYKHRMMDLQQRFNHGLGSAPTMQTGWMALANQVLGKFR